MHQNRRHWPLPLHALRKRVVTSALLLFALAGLAQLCLAANSVSVKYEVNRVGRALIPAALPTPQEYISGFILYVRWPSDAAIGTWQICVAAPASANDAHYADLVVRDRKFVVRHVKTGDALGSCQVLDLTAVDADTTQGFLKAAQAQPGLLTVGDGKDFCSAGGLICLHLKEPRGGFEVNLSAVKNAGFSINAKLLMMARQPAPEAAPP
jgi:hypothetical protein